MDACDAFKGWNGQSEPTARHQKGKPVPVATKVNEVIGKLIEVLRNCEFMKFRGEFRFHAIMYFEMEF